MNRCTGGTSIQCEWTLCRFSCYKTTCTNFKMILWQNIDYCKSYRQDRPKRNGCPGQANNLVPLKPTMFKLFRLTTGLASIFEGGCPKRGKFSVKFFRKRVENLSVPAKYFRLFQWHSALCSSDRASWRTSYKTTNQMHQISKTLFCHKTPHISGIFCAHHHELSTVHTAIGMLHAGYVTAS
jgi:hypothetical protein